MLLFSFAAVGVDAVICFLFFSTFCVATGGAVGMFLIVVAVGADAVACFMLLLVVRLVQVV